MKTKISTKLITILTSSFLFRIVLYPPEEKTTGVYLFLILFGVIATIIWHRLEK